MSVIQSASLFVCLSVIPTFVPQPNCLLSTIIRRRRSEYCWIIPVSLLTELEANNYANFVNKESVSHVLSQLYWLFVSTYISKIWQFHLMPLKAVFHQTQYDRIFCALFNWNFFSVAFITSSDTRWLRQYMTQSLTNQIARISTSKYICNKLTQKSVRHRTFQHFRTAKQRWGAKTSHWYVTKLI